MTPWRADFERGFKVLSFHQTMGHRSNGLNRLAQKTRVYQFNPFDLCPIYISDIAKPIIHFNKTCEIAGWLLISANDFIKGRILTDEIVLVKT